jgi:alpha-ketoglutarate-dependent 2,4-dichlorophenoxyacetate dioxygenase
MQLVTRPLHPLFGVEIEGVQVCEPLDDATFAAIRALFETHSLLLFRDQRLDDDGHLAFSERFGPLETTVKGNPAAGSRFARQSNLDIESGQVIPEGDPRLTYLKAARLWHTDSSFKPVPALASLLAGHICPPEGANTEFASCRAAWDDLPESTRRRLWTLRAVHSQMHTLSRIDPSIITDAMRGEIAPVEQPMVRVNPVNERRAVYVGAHAGRVVGLPDEEGAELIRELNAHTTQERYVYSHRWRAGDLVVWDNRATLHRATPYDAAKYKRLLQRATVAGNEADYRWELGLRDSVAA